MSIKTVLKKADFVTGAYVSMIKGYYSVLTLISPQTNTKARYKRNFGRKLPLDNPQTLNEKVLWLKLNRYMEDPLVIQCADKYAVREYVKDCGCGEILNELYGVYESAYDIPWDELPDKFVLKWNFGAGYNVICTDKSQMDKEKTLKQLDDWGKKRCWLPYSEMQYKYIPKRIVCEKLIESNSI